ncbi:hypothetical protein [Catenulispora yoronensis]|uniref:hypothetical protein n=1 Tax=Catenulispora yoronensis TaxID=450799 RepID=UPI0031D65699
MLVIPGALYLAAIGVATTLGQAHALDVGRLHRRITAAARNPAVANGTGQIVLLVAALAAAALVGLAAQVSGRVVEHAVLAADWYTWPRPLRAVARWRIRRRAAAWDKAEAAYQAEREKARAALELGRRADRAERDRAYAMMLRISEGRPERPTWSGERMHAVTTQLGESGIDLPREWPRLWLTFPDSVRKEITAARGELTRATTLGGWAVLYLLLTAWWWPAALVAAVVGGTARYRVRGTVDTYAQLVEAGTLLQGREGPA